MEANLFTNFRKYFCHIAISGVAALTLLSCSDASPESSGTSAPKKMQPYLHIVGDTNDVGSIVYVDGEKAAVIENKFLSMIRVYVPVREGKRIIEVRKDGALRMRKVINVKQTDHSIPLPARVDPPASPDLSPPASPDLSPNE